MTLPPLAARVTPEVIVLAGVRVARALLRLGLREVAIPPRSAAERPGAGSRRGRHAEAVDAAVAAPADAVVAVAGRRHAHAHAHARRVLQECCVATIAVGVGVQRAARAVVAHALRESRAGRGAAAVGRVGPVEARHAAGHGVHRGRAWARVVGVTAVGTGCAGPHPVGIGAKEVALAVLVGEFRSVLVEFEIHVRVRDKLKAGHVGVHLLARLAGVHGVQRKHVRVARDRHAVHAARLATVGQTALVHNVERRLGLLVHHGRDEGLVQGRVAEARSEPLAAQTLFLLETALGVLGDVEGRVVADLVVELAGGDELEDEHEERQRNDGEGVSVVGALATDPAGKEEDEVGEHRGEDDTVEHDAPEHASRLGLGDEDVEQEVALQPDVNGEIQGHGRQGDGLDAGEAQSNGRVVEEVVVVGRIVEGRGRRELDEVARGGARELAGEEAVDQGPELGQVNGSTELALEEPVDPEGADGAEGEEQGVGDVLLEDGVPGIGTVAGPVDDTGDESPGGAEQGEDDQVVEDEEGVQLGDDVTLATALGLVTGLDRQTTEDDGQNKEDERGDGRRGDTLDESPEGLVLDELGLELTPDAAQVVEVDEEDGDHGVGSDPDEERPVGRQLGRVLHVLGEDGLELANRVVVLGDELGQILDVACDGGAGEGGAGDDLVDDAGDALVGAARPRVQAVLVLVALEVTTAQVQHLFRVPPQEEHDNGVDAVGDGDLGPLRVAPDVRGREHGQPGAALARDIDLREVDGDQDGENKDAEGDEEVPQHFDEAHKNGGVHAGVLDEFVLGGAPQGEDPGPELAADGRRGVLLVGMFGLGGVDGLVVGSQEGEGNGDAEREQDRRTKGSEEGGLLELSRVTSVGVETRPANGNAYLSGKGVLQEIQQFLPSIKLVLPGPYPLEDGIH
ncbi:hypothetical protein BN1708_015037, partial [Verticillium longisporum]